MKNYTLDKPVYWVAFIWLGCVFFIDPRGNFPLNDDWTLAYPIKSFIETGEIKFSWPPAVTSIVHLILGWLFCIGDFSFFNLRLYVLICSILSFFALRYFFSKSGNHTGFAATLFLFNPIFLCLSFTFMSDVPFFLFSILTVTAGLSLLKNINNTFTLFTFTLLATAATLIRQPAIVIPFSFALVIIFQWQSNSGKDKLRSIIPFIVTLSALCLYEFFLKYKIGFPKNINQSLGVLQVVSENIIHLLLRLCLVVIKCIIYFGLFTLPLLLYFDFFKNFSLKAYSVLILISTFLITYLYINGKVFPFGGGNIIVNLGVGPIFLGNSEENILPNNINNGFFIALSIFGAFAGLTILYKIVQQIRVNRFLDSESSFLFLIIICFIPVTSLIGFFDRYILFPLALFMFFILKISVLKSYREYRKTFSVLGIAWLLATAAFAVAATKDYLSWNRARWQALNYLESKQISSLEINGGYEYNGWKNYHKISPTEAMKMWWWVKDDIYMVSFSRLPNYNIIRVYPYQGWLPITQNKILLLKRKP